MLVPFNCTENAKWIYLLIVLVKKLPFTNREQQTEKISKYKFLFSITNGKRDFLIKFYFLLSSLLAF